MVMGVDPDQVSPDSVSVWPSVVVPETKGRWVFVGGTPAMTAVGTETAEVLPAELVAFTTTTRVCPTSALVRM